MALVLLLPDFMHPYHLETDALGVGVELPLYKIKERAISQ